MKTIDIVVTTRNRLECLQRTLAYIYERTRWPYRLHVIDDASEEDNAVWLFEEWRAGRIHTLALRGERCGAMANLNLGAWAAFSDPTVFTDDDVLCPDVRPCWLERGMREMEKRKNLGMLALHHPGAKYKVRKYAGTVHYSLSLGGTFLFVRRSFLLAYPLPHQAGLLARPIEARCRDALDDGWDIGYLAETYCYHFGRDSVLTGKPYDGRFIDVIDDRTLEPRTKVSGRGDG